MARRVSWLLLISLPLAAEPTFRLTPVLEDNSIWLSHSDEDNTKTQDQWLNEFKPGLGLHGSSQFHQVDLDYQAQYLSYLSGDTANNSESLNHLLNARTESELLDRHLFLNTQAHMGQILTTADGRRSVDQASAPQDYSQYRSYQVNPRWQQAIGSGRLDLAYSYGQSHVAAPEQPLAAEQQVDASQQDINAKLQSDPQSRLYAYLNYVESQEQPASNLIEDSGDKKTQAYVHYRWSRQWLTLLRGGHEEYYGPQSQKSLNTSGDYLSAGVTWQPGRWLTASVIGGNKEAEANLVLQPNQRNQLHLTYQQRDLGLGDQDGWTLALSHQGRNAWLQLQRKRSIVTQSRLLVLGQPYAGSLGIQPYLTYLDKQNDIMLVTRPNNQLISQYNNQSYYLGNPILSQSTDEIYAGIEEGEIRFAPRSWAPLEQGASRYINTENSLNTGYERGRSRVELSYSDSNRQLIDMGLAPSRLRTLELNYRFHLTSRDDLSYNNLNEQNDEPAIQRKGFYFEHKLSWEHWLRKSIKTSLSYSYHDFDSNKALLDYQEHRLSAGIRVEY